MPKKRSPTKILESRTNPRIEGAYFRHPGEEFQEAAHRASESKVVMNYSRLTPGKSYTSLHTHPLGAEDVQGILVKDEKGNMLKGPNNPSGGDITSFLGDSYAKTMIITQQDPKTGEIGGYYFVRKTKKTPKFPQAPTNMAEIENTSDKKTREDLWKKYFEYLRHPEIKKLDRDVQENYHKPNLFEGEYSAEKGKFVPKIGPDGNPIDREDYSGKFHSDLLKNVLNKYGLQSRAVSAKGYAYLPGIGFKKKEKVTLEKIAASILIAAIAAFALLNSNITGFGILNKIPPAGNFIRVIMMSVILCSAVFLISSKINSLWKKYRFRTIEKILGGSACKALKTRNQ